MLKALRLLCGLQLQGLAASVTRATAGKRPRGRVLALVLVVYCVGLLGYLLKTYYDMLAAPLLTLGLGWLYFTLAGLAATALAVMGSLFLAKSQLYEARDNDQLLCLPLPPAAILASRMLTLYLYTLAWSTLALVPALLAWLGAGGGASPALAVLFLLMPAPALALACALGWVLALITGRMRNKSLVTVTCSLVFLAGYFYLNMKAGNWVVALAADASRLAGRFDGVAPLAWFGQAAMGDAGALGLTALTLLLPLAAVYALLNATFMHMATTRRAPAHRRYRARATRATRAMGVGSALVRRELTHFAASAVWLLNGGLGLLMLAAGTVYLCWQAGAVRPVLAQLDAAGAPLPLAAMLAGVVGLMLSTCMIAAPSLSLEGRQLYILQSLPIAPARILFAKLYAQCIVCTPFVVLCVPAAGLALGLDAGRLALTLVVSLLLNLWMAIVGVVFGLLMPNFDWRTEAQPVKRGAAVTLSMLVGIASMAMLGVLYAVTRRAVTETVFLALAGVLLAALTAAALWWLHGAGARRLTALAA